MFICVCVRSACVEHTPITVCIMFCYDDLGTRVLATVVNGCKCVHLFSRFLVAIDRRNGTEVAMETVKLAEDFMLSSDGLVLGLDLSGDPTVSTN